MASLVSTTVNGDLKVTGSSNLFFEGSASSNTFEPGTRIYGAGITLTGGAYTSIFEYTVPGGLAGNFRFFVKGTTGNVVVPTQVDVVLNHSKDITIKSQTGNYTPLHVKVLTNNNEDCLVQLKADTSGNANVTVYIDVIAFGDGSVSFSSFGSYTGTSLEHKCNFGFSFSAIDNTNASKFVMDGGNADGGRLGIGTNSPAQPLDVLGKVSINSDGTLNWGAAKDYGRLTWSSTNSRAIVRGESGKNLSLGANGTQDYVFIKTDGNVGIGTTDPGARLDLHAGNMLIGDSYLDHHSSNDNYGLQIKSIDTNQVALELRSNGGNNGTGTWRTTLYATAQYYGFLDSAWGAWDIKKNVNGALQIDQGSGLETVLTTATGMSSSTAWANMGAGTRFNYTLKFQPPASSYAGFQFMGTNSNNAGYFLIRGTSDSDVYTAEGITLVADQGWLTLAQRTASSKGVKIMTGTTSRDRITVSTDGDIVLGVPTNSLAPATTTTLKGYSVQYDSGGAGARLSNQGFLIWNTGGSWTGNERMWAFTNADNMGGGGGPRFALLRGSNNSTVPTLGNNGSLGTNTLRTCYWTKDGAFHNAGPVSIVTETLPTSNKFHVSSGQGGSASKSSIAVVSVADNSTFNNGVAALHVINSGNRGTTGNSIGSDLLRLEFSDGIHTIFNKDGSVGIGTTDPSGLLTVYQGELTLVSSASYNTHLNYQNGGSHYITMANGGATYFRGSSNSITTMTVLGSGSVGIGGSPSAALDIFAANSSSIAIRIVGGNKAQFLNAASNTNANIYNAGSSGNSDLTFQISGTSIYTMTSGSFYPVADGAKDLGLSGNRWNNVYSEAGNFSGNLTLAGNSTSRFYFGNKLAIEGQISNNNLDLGENFANIRLRSSSDVFPTNSVNLGTSANRWTTIYGAAGNFSGTVTATTFSGTLSGTADKSNMVTGSAFATTGSPGSVLEYQQASGQTDTKLAPTTDWYNTIRMGHGNPYTYYSNTIAMQMTGTGAGQIRTQWIANGNAQGWRTVWDNVNDGSGSGLDADLLDGQHGSYYLTASNLTGTPPNTYVYGDDTLGAFASSTFAVNPPRMGFFNINNSSTENPDGSSYWQGLHFRHNNQTNTWGWQLTGTYNTSYDSLFFRQITSGSRGSWNRIWSSNNDGSGSGLDADKLDGLQATSFLRSDADDTTTGNLKIGSAGSAYSGTGVVSLTVNGQYPVLALGNTSNRFSILAYSNYTNYETVGSADHVFSGGSVGIGTTDPGEKLHIVGNLKFTPANNRGIYFNTTSGQEVYIRSKSGSLGEIQIGSDNKIEFVETDANSVRFLFDTNSGTFTPGSNGYDLGSTSKRWEFYGTSGNFSGTVTAGNISGNGSGLTSLNASNISSGTVAAARLGSGSSITTKFLRGDNTWQTVSSGSSPNNATITLSAGTNLSGGGNFTTNQSSNETITFNMSTGGAGAGTYGDTSNSIKIDTITLDAYGRVTAVATGATGSGSMSSWNWGISGSTTSISQGETVRILAGTNVTVSRSGNDVTVNASGGGGSGTVTSVATSTGLQGGTITTSGTLSVTGAVCMSINAPSGSAAPSGRAFDFLQSGGITISASGNNVTFSSSSASDYRLKKNVTDFNSESWTKVKSVSCRKFDFDAEKFAQAMEDDYTIPRPASYGGRIGFIAHELEALGIDGAVEGEKDGVDENGVPIYQKVSYTTLVPVLWGALNEAIRKIEILESKVQALEDSS